MPPSVVQLPVGLTLVQSELISLLQHIHQTEASSKVNTSNDPSTGNRSAYLDDLVASLTNITNHPYLLVPHYMPMKLLLMEPHSKFKEASDKFVQFDCLLSLLLSQQRRSKDTESSNNDDNSESAEKQQPLHVVVVGNSIKELDFIEAFVLGWDGIVYKRYSGSSLVDDYDHLVDQSTLSSNEQNSSSAGSGGKEKETDEYIRKRIAARKLKNDKSGEGIMLHLTTLSQLKLPLLTKYSYQYVISFNTELTENDLPQSLESNPFAIVFSTLNVPTSEVFKLTHNDKNNNNALKEGAETENPVNIVVNEDGSNVALTNEELAKALESKKLSDWPFKREPNLEIKGIQAMIALLNTPPQTTPSSSHSDKRIKLDLSPQIAKDYQTELTKLVQGKITDFSNSTSSIIQQIKALRIQATIKHNQLDKVKLQTGVNFKELQRLKETVTGVEKKFERLESEYEKYENLQRELHIEIKDLTEYQNELSLIPEQVSKHEDLFNELNAFNDTLSTKIDKLTSEIDTLRSTYQTTTSQAVSLSAELSQLTTQSTELKTKIQGKGKQLRSLQVELHHLSNQEAKQKLLKEIEFLRDYNNKLESIIKEKAVASGGNGVNGVGGNSSNGGFLSGNGLTGRSGRLHRSATPY